MNKLINQGAQSLIEVIIALSLIAIVFTGSWQIIHDSYMSINEEMIGLKANYLVIEGLEGIRSIRDEDWNSIVDGTWHFTYNETNPSDKYIELVAGDEVVLNYTRRIVISSVGRNSDTGKITDPTDPLYVIDPDTKLVDVIVEWQYLGKTRTDIESIYLTKKTEMIYG